jgi:hypothetical protein
MLRERSSPYGNALVGVSRGSGNGGASLVRGCWRRVGRFRRCRPVGIRFARPGTSRREEVGRSQGYSTASRHLIGETRIVTVLTRPWRAEPCRGVWGEALGKQGNGSHGSARSKHRMAVVIAAVSLAGCDWTTRPPAELTCAEWFASSHGTLRVAAGACLSRPLR